MAKPLKIVVALIGALLLLLVAAAVALPLLFDPNDYRGKIAEAVKKETGREFSVGDIRLAVFPWLRVELREVKLGNAEGFGAEPMLTVQRVEVGAKLMPLLREKRIETSAITLDGAAVNLAVNPEGINNWQDLMKPADPEVPVSDESLAQRLKALDIKGITLDNVSLRYDDRKAGQQYQLNDLKLKIGRLHAGAPFPVEGSFKVKAATPAADAAMEFSTEVALDATSGDVTLGKPQFKLDATQAGAQPLAVVMALHSESLHYATAAQMLSGSPLKLEIDSLRVGAADKPTITAKGNIKTLLSADLAKQLHSLKGLEVDLQLGGSALPGGKPQALKLGASIAADLAAKQVKISDLQLAAFGLSAAGKQWLVSKLGDEAQLLEGDLAVAAFDPRAVMTTLGIAAPQTADANVLKSLSLSTQISAGSKSASLKNLLLKLDDTTLRGDLAVRDFATQAMSFALKADRLDADRYLPPAAPVSAVTTATPATKSDLNATKLPIEALEKLNVQGTLDVASLKVKSLKLANVRVKLDGAAGATHRQQLSADLYGGKANFALSVAPGARHALKLSLASINAGPLLKDFLATDKLSGKGSFTLDVTTAGRTVGEVRRALNGNLAFNLADGAVKGFNLGKIMRDGQALLTAQAAPSGGAQATDFAELRGSGVIINGVLKSDQLSAKNPLIRLEGAGEIDLVKETINYLAKPTLVNTASGQGGKERTDLSGIVIPIRISGNLYAPKVSIDWQAALKQQAATQLREKLGVSEETVREKREELRGKAKEEIGKSLMKLFGNKPAQQPAAPPPGQ